MSIWSGLKNVLTTRNEQDALAAALSIPAGDSDSDSDQSQHSFRHNPVATEPQLHYPPNNNSHYEISIDVEAGDGYMKGLQYQMDRQSTRDRSEEGNVTQDTYIKDLLEHEDELDNIIASLNIGRYGVEEEEDEVSFLGETEPAQQYEKDAEQEGEERVYRNHIDHVEEQNDEDEEGDLDLVAYLQRHEEYKSHILKAVGVSGTGTEHLRIEIMRDRDEMVEGEGKGEDIDGEDGRSEGPGLGSGGISPVWSHSVSSHQNHRTLSRNSSFSAIDRRGGGGNGAFGGPNHGLERDYFLGQQTVQGYYDTERDRERDRYRERDRDGDNSSFLSSMEQTADDEILLYNQLNELEEVTSKLQSIYSSTRTFPLTPEQSLFVDVESGGRDIRADFVLNKDLLDNEVLMLRVFCLPSYVMEEDSVCRLNKLRVPGIDFLPLQCRLVYHQSMNAGDREADSILSHLDQEVDNEQNEQEETIGIAIEIQPILFNGEYCITLTNTRQRFTFHAGHYSLYVNTAESTEDPLYAHHNAGILGDNESQCQSLQISYQIYPMVHQATAISANNMIIQDRISIYQGRHNMKFFRFVLTDVKKYVKFTMRPLSLSSLSHHEKRERDKERENEEDYDLDMFITNHGQGLIPVNVDNAQWSTTVSSSHKKDSSVSLSGHATATGNTVSVTEVLPTDPKLSSALPLMIYGDREKARKQAQEESLYLDDSQSDRQSKLEREIENEMQTFTIGICCRGLFEPHDFHRSRFDDLLLDDEELRDNNGNRRREKDNKENEKERFHAFEFSVETRDYLPILHSHSFMTSDHEKESEKKKEVQQEEDQDEERGKVMENEESQCVVKKIENVVLTELSYHAIPVNPYYASQILVSLQIPPPSASSSDQGPKLTPFLSKRFKSMEDAMKTLKIQNKSNVGGKLVKCSKMLPMNVHGFDDAYTQYRMTAINKLFKSSELKQVQVTNGNEAERHKQLFRFTVLYISHLFHYPGPDCYHYRATGGTEVSFIINSNEWKYNSNVCHFSLYVCDFDVTFLDELLTAKRNTKVDGDLVDYLVKRKGVCHFLSSSSSSLMNGDEKRLLDQPVLLHLWRECLEDSTVGNSLIAYTPSSSHVSSQQWQLSNKLSLFHNIFRTIDGERLTYRDREGVDYTVYPFEPLCPSHYAKYGLGSAGGGLVSVSNLTSTSWLSTLHRDRDRAEEEEETEIEREKGRERDVESVEIDDHSLTYSEIEFTSFVSFLHSLPAVDGQILYDLGCGVGRVLVASALSGICFLKVCGLEVLPSLATCCADVLQSLQTQSQTQTVHAQGGQGQQGSTSFLVRSSPLKFNINRAMNANSDMISPTAHQKRPAATRLFASPTHEDSLIAWLTNRTQLDATANGNGSVCDDDNMSMNSFLTQSSCSYQVTAIPDLKDRLKKAKVKLPIMEVRNENFLENLSWLEADIVFASSLCYSEVIVKTMIEIAQGLKPGAHLITSKLSRNYSKWFDLMKSVSINLSCGEVIFYVLKRNNAATM